MEADKCFILLVGDSLRWLSQIERKEIHTKYLEDGKALLDFLKKEYPSGNHLAFISFPSKKSILDFIANLKEEPEGLFLSTPLIACLTGALSVKPVVLETFDYILFHSPDRTSLPIIAQYVWMQKQRSIAEKKHCRVNDTIASELFERLKNIEEKTEKAPEPADLYYIVDDDGIIQTINDEVLYILGFSKEEIIGHHFSDFIVQEEFKRVKNAFIERRTGGRQTRNLIVKMRKKDGNFEEFSIDARGVHLPSVREHPERNPHRIFIGTYGRATKRKHPGVAFDLFTSSYLPLIMYDPEKKSLTVNSGFEQYSGYRNLEVEGKSPALFEKKGYNYFEKCLGQISNTGHCTYTTIFVDKAGKEKLCEVALEQVDLNGKSRIIGMYSDITGMMELIDEADMLIQLSWIIGNSKSMGELLELAVSRGASILKVPYMLCVVLDERGENFEYCYVQNGKGQVRSDVDVAEYLSLMIHESINEKKTVYRSLRDVAKFCDIQQIIDRERDEESTLVASPLVINNRGIGCIVALYRKENTYTLQRTRLLEISTNVIAAGIQRLRLEKKIRNTLENLESRVKERTKDLEDFVYTVSHDLKSPLHAARGFAAMIKKQFASAIKTEDDAFVLRRVEENIGDALRMIDRLLQLSRVGTRELRFETVDLNTIINDYFVEYKALKRGGGNAELQMKEKLPSIAADRSRMVQLFTNIFDNSVKYMNGERVIITVSGKQVDDRVIISIEDDGIGIQERDLPNIFNIFYRGRTPLSPDTSEGAGVGLSIVKKIVEQHDGEIEVLSTPRKGTKVIVSLPISR